MVHVWCAVPTPFSFRGLVEGDDKILTTIRNSWSGSNAQEFNKSMTSTERFEREIEE